MRNTAADAVFKLWMLVPSVALALVFAVAYLTSESSVVLAYLSARQVQGTLLLFALLPGYLLLVWRFQNRSTLRVVAAYEPLALSEQAQAQLQRAELRRQRLHPAAWLLVIFGFIFGAQQNEFFITRLFSESNGSFLDWAFVGGNCLTWTVVLWLLAWRLPLSYALSKVGELLNLDLYRTEQLEPAGRMATLDILAIAGAMSLMVFQSLDAEFRWGNYLPGIGVGVPSAILLFFLPLWGLRKNLIRSKRQRVEEIQSALAACDRLDWARLEMLSAHRQRIRDLPNLPLNLALAMRIAAYTVIPPLAWVAAALVENVVDQIAG